MDSTHYNKIMELLDDKNTNQQISLQTINKNADILISPVKTKGDKFMFSLIDNHSMIPKI